MAVTRETVELMVRKAISEAEKRARQEHREHAQEIEKILTPLSQLLDGQTRDLLLLSDECRNAVDGIRSMNQRFQLMEERVYKGDGQSIVERLARLEQPSVNSGPHAILPRVSAVVSKEITIASMTNRNRLYLGIIAVAPTTLAALLAWLATR